MNIYKPNFSRSDTFYVPFVMTFVPANKHSVRSKDI